MNVRDNGNCFACGPLNECGLQMKVEPTAEGCRAEVVLARRFEGFEKITHGGIVATLLDEMIAWACKLKGRDAVTAELVVRYKRPVPVGEPLEVRGWIVREHGRLLFGESSIADGRGVVLASATGKMMT